MLMMAGTGSSEDLQEDIIHFEKINKVRSAISKLPEDEIELIVMVYYSAIVQSL